MVKDSVAVRRSLQHRATRSVSTCVLSLFRLTAHALNYKRTVTEQVTSVPLTNHTQTAYIRHSVSLIRLKASTCARSRFYAQVFYKVRQCLGNLRATASSPHSEITIEYYVSIS